MEYLVMSLTLCVVGVFTLVERAHLLPDRVSPP